MYKMDEKRYLDFYEAYLRDGISSLSFLTAYVLYCDAKLFYPGHDIDGFTKEVDQWLCKWINKANDSDILFSLRLIKEDKELFPGVFANCLIDTKRYRGLSEETVEAIIEEWLIPLPDLLKCKGFAQRFETAIRTYLLSKADSISFLIDKWDRGIEYYLPRFSGKEINAIIEAYLMSNFRNPSQLNLLLNHKNSPESYSIDPQQRGRIRKALEESVNDPNIVILKGEEIEWETGLDDEIKTPCFIGYQNGHYRMVASRPYVDENSGVGGLFATLSKALLLFDEQIRLYGLHNPLWEERLIVEFEHRTIGQYGGETFREKEALKTSQFLTVAEYLKNKGDSIEKRLEEIAASLSDKNGKNLGFRISLYPDYAPIPKTEGIFNQIESLMKQYYVLKTYGELTAELFGDTAHPRIRSLKSVDKKNYLCLPVDEKRLLAEKILFLEKPYQQDRPEYSPAERNFATAFLLKDIRMEQLSWLDQRWAQTLLENGLIVPNVDGFLKFADEKQIKVLAKLARDQFVYRKSIPLELLSAADELVRKGLIDWYDGLFSKQEEEFMDYYLTNEKPRAAALRNKYEHGSTYQIDDKTAMLDYCSGLRLLCCLVFKIKKEVESWD